MDTPPPNPPTPVYRDPPGPRGDAALYCPGCGYNLTGVCSPEHPAGACPECGRAFVRHRLLSTQAARSRAPNMFIGLLVWPAVIAFCLPIAACGVGGLLQDAAELGVVVFVAIVLGACAMTGWWLADRVVLAKRVGRDPDEVPAFYRHTAWPWLLFSFAHLVLALTYFAGGCALIIAVLFSG